MFFFIISGRKKHTIVIYIRRNGMKVLKYIQNETQMNYLKMTEILYQVALFYNNNVFLYGESRPP